MPITYEIEGATGLLAVTWHGAVTLQELAQHWDRLRADPRFPQVPCAVTDLRGATFAFNSADFWRTIDNHYRDAIEGKAFRVALLVANDDHERHAVIWKTLLPGTVTARLFRDPGQARAWLLGPPEAGSP